ncbi:MAG: hypothetical protein HQM10_01405 [Candidatus Riflebacteria bacterium]|nr:hypothetical protein [Candidatus Riflebacteria bacterium]
MIDSSLRRMVCWLFLVFFSCYLLLSRGHFISTDEVQVYQASESFWSSLDFSVQLSEGVPGRDGRLYSMVNSGQAVAVFPLLAISKAVKIILQESGRADIISVLAGSMICEGNRVWGGKIEIFFVNLLNSFLTAALVVVFFVFNLKLGASPLCSLSATFILGLATLPASYSSTFFQHSSECFFLLWSFYFLFEYSRTQNKKSQIFAGITAAMMIQFRYPSVIALPGLILYHFVSMWHIFPDRTSWQRAKSVIKLSFPFLLLLAAGLLLHAIDQYYKFGTIFAVGNYAKEGFTTPIITGLYGYIFSPGHSIILFSPPILLAPWFLRLFIRKFRFEAYFILFQTVVYLIFYSKFLNWHGMWAFGPRYLCAVVPLLLLPAAIWIQSQKKQALFLVGILSIAGFWVQITHFMVNFWNVVLAEKYLEFKPLYCHLFIPEMSPLIAHSKALFRWDNSVDMWILNILKKYGMYHFIAAIILPLTVLLTSITGLFRNIRKLPSELILDIISNNSGVFMPIFSKLFPFIFLMFTAVFGIWNVDQEINKWHQYSTILENTVQNKLMEYGLIELKTKNNPKNAIKIFSTMLKFDPNHFGAGFQLARALDSAGRVKESILYYSRALSFAVKYGDKVTEGICNTRLKEIGNQ